MTIPRIDIVLTEALTLYDGDTSPSGTAAREAITRALDALRERDSAQCLELTEAALAAIAATED